MKNWKYVVTLPAMKSEIHIYPVKKSRLKNASNHFKEKGFNWAVNDMPKDVKAIARDGMFSHGQREPVLDGFIARKTFFDSKSGFHVERECKQRGADVLYVEPVRIDGDKKPTREEIKALSAVVKGEKAAKLRKASAENHFKAIVSATNLLLSTRAYELEEGRPVKIALFTTKQKARLLKKIFDRPDLSELYAKTFKATNGRFGKHVWQGPVRLKPKDIVFLNAELKAKYFDKKYRAG